MDPNTTYPLPLPKPPGPKKKLLAIQNMTAGITLKGIKKTHHFFGRAALQTTARRPINICRTKRLARQTERQVAKIRGISSTEVKKCHVF